jgi:hypothetical protein
MTLVFIFFHLISSSSNIFYFILNYLHSSLCTMILILYNCVVVRSAITSHQNLIFMMSDQQLIEYIHNSQNRKLLALQRLNVKFVHDNIIFAQIDSHRSLYLNVILIQSRDCTMMQSCLACRNERSSLRSFSKCRRAVEHFEEACVNCKWHDHVNRCFVREYEMNDDVIIVDHRRLKSSRFDENDRTLDNDDNDDDNSKSNVIVLY